MKTKFLLICILFFSLHSVMANNYGMEIEAQKKKPDKVETKAFSSVNDLYIDHSYGKIQLIENTTNDIQMEIRYFYGTKNNIPECTTKQSGGKLEIVTANAGKHNARIDYIISIPRKINFTGKLKYGEIELNDFWELFKCDMSYSELNAGSFKTKAILTGNYNDISINDASELMISCNYTDVKLGKIEQLMIKAKYSDYEVKDVRNMTFEADYGDAKIASVQHLSVKLKYTDVIIDRLSESLSADCNYSDIDIKKTDSKLQSVNFSGNYSDITLSLHSEISANIDFQTTYGDTNISKNIPVKYTFSEEKTIRETYRGTLGRGNPNANIKIAVTYGDIKIK